MKKLICALICTLLLFTCWACANNGSNTQQSDDFVFEAVVKAINDDSILVMPVADTKEADAAMGIGVLVVKNDSIPQVQVGDRVRIRYDGVMTRSIPPQLGQVLSFEVIE